MDIFDQININFNSTKAILIPGNSSIIPGVSLASDFNYHLNERLTLFVNAALLIARGNVQLSTPDIKGTTSVRVTMYVDGSKYAQEWMTLLTLNTGLGISYSF